MLSPLAQPLSQPILNLTHPHRHPTHTRMQVGTLLNAASSALTSSPPPAAQGPSSPLSNASMGGFAAGTGGAMEGGHSKLTHAATTGLGGLMVPGGGEEPFSIDAPLRRGSTVGGQGAMGTELQGAPSTASTTTLGTASVPAGGAAGVPMLSRAEALQRPSLQQSGPSFSSTITSTTMGEHSSTSGNAGAGAGAGNNSGGAGGGGGGSGSATISGMACCSPASMLSGLGKRYRWVLRDLCGMSLQAVVCRGSCRTFGESAEACGWAEGPWWC